MVYPSGYSTSSNIDKRTAEPKGSDTQALYDSQAVVKSQLSVNLVK